MNNAGIGTSTAFQHRRALRKMGKWGGGHGALIVAFDFVRWRFEVRQAHLLAVRHDATFRSVLRDLFDIANPTSRIRGQNGRLSSDHFANLAKGLHYRSALFAYFSAAISAVTSAAWGW